MHVQLLKLLHVEEDRWMGHAFCGILMVFRLILALGLLLNPAD
jgi:hypothetical protein